MNKDYTITTTFTIDQVNLILGALAKLPLEVSADLFYKIKSIAERQVTEAQEAVAAKEVAPTE